MTKAYKLTPDKLALLGLKKYGHNRYYDPESKKVYLIVPIKVYASILKMIERHKQ